MDANRPKRILNVGGIETEARPVINVGAVQVRLMRGLDADDHHLSVSYRRGCVRGQSYFAQIIVKAGLPRMPDNKPGSGRGVRVVTGEGVVL